MKKEPIKTPYTLEKEAKDLQVYREHKELMTHEGAMATAVDDFIMKKYGIFGSSTVWNIRKRVEKRIAGNPELALTPQQA